MNYILMNKDPAWLSCSCRRDEFDEVECSGRERYTELRSSADIDREQTLQDPNISFEV